MGGGDGGYGAYGKIPALGDFLRIGLASDFIRAWDTWLQSAMTMARDDLAARWRDCYMSAPIWRFTLPGGLAGRAPVLGVVMPSVDRVGRQFPLTLAAHLPGDADPVATHLEADRQFEALELVALGALEDNCGREALTHALAQVPKAIGCPGHSEDDPAGITLPPGAKSAAMARGAGPVGVWTCMIGGARHQMITRSWPTRHQIAGLMNLKDPQWTSAMWQRGAAG